jgi:transcriptional regulator with XRE-family HTH domain
MTKLARYLKAAEIRQTDFAELVGTSQRAVSEISSGRTQPTFDLAVAVEIATNGEVRLEDWPAFEALKNRPKPPPKSRSKLDGQ